MMKLAYSANLQSATEFPVMVSQFRSLGYEGLQLKGGQWTPGLADLDRFMAELGQVKGAASGLITYGGLDNANQDHVRQAIQFAAKIGAERVIFCLFGSRAGLTTGGYDHYAKLFCELGREARDVNVWLSLHNHRDCPFMNEEDFRQILGRIGLGVVEMTVDTAHLGLGGVTDMAGVIREFHEFIGNFHMKDLRAGEFRMLGAGDIDFAPIFEAIRDVGYDGWMSADEESGAELMHAMTHCHAFMVDGLSVSSAKSAVDLKIGRTADCTDKH